MCHSSKHILDKCYIPVSQVIRLFNKPFFCYCVVKIEHECQCITKARIITFKGADFDIMIKILNMAFEHIKEACPKDMTLNYIGAGIIYNKNYKIFT